MTGSRISSRTSVSPVTAVPRRPAKRAPASPPTATPRAARTSSRRPVARRHRSAVPAICSTNVRRPQVTVSQKKRRTCKRPWTGRPHAGKSRRGLRYVLCTRSDRAPQPGQRLAAALGVASTTICSSSSRMRRTYPRPTGTPSRLNLMLSERPPPPPQAWHGITQSAEEPPNRIKATGAVLDTVRTAHNSGP
jgi:hypothetical protein